MIKRDPEKYQLAFANANPKRNVLSALRAKIRRSSSDLTKAEEKYQFSPVLSVGELNFLNKSINTLIANKYMTL